MFIRSICKVVFTISLAFAILPSHSMAEDHPAPKEEGGDHEAPKEGGGGEAKAETKEEPKSSLQPWVELENKITELNSKIKSKEANIQKLIEDKKHLDNNSPALKTVVKEIVKEHKEMRQLVEEYDKKVTLLKYRFPERNAAKTRTYDRFEIKSVEEMEKAVGVDGKLNRNLRRMRSQFKSETKPAVVQEATVREKPAVPSKKKEPSIEEAGTIIIHK